MLALLLAIMSQPPDFAAIIAGLESAGLGRSEIARQAGISKTYVTQLAAGDRREPRWTVGDRLLNLAEKKLSVFAIANKE